MDLVDVRLFRGEGDVLADFVAHIAEQGVVDEVLDDGMLVSCKEGVSERAQWLESVVDIRLRGGVVASVAVEHRAVKEAFAEVPLRFLQRIRQRIHDTLRGLLCVGFLLLF